MEEEIVLVPEHHDPLEECLKRLFPKECGMTDEGKMWSKICEGYLAIIVAIFGVVGNSMSLVVLLDETFIDVFNKLLVSLSVCDILFLSKSNNQYNKNSVYLILCPNNF